jgi:hypothetical protein
MRFPALSVIVIGLSASACFADIRVTVRGIDGLERNVGPLHASGAPITLST